MKSAVLHDEGHRLRGFRAEPAQTEIGAPDRCLERENEELIEAEQQ